MRCNIPEKKCQKKGDGLIRLFKILNIFLFVLDLKDMS